MLSTDLARLGLLSVLSCAAGAQSFSYPDFASTAGLNLLGDAVQSGSAVQLTTFVNVQTGWAWRTTPMPVAAGFDTTFSFRITPPATGKGEGMALIIQDDPAGANAMGGQIWGMGYGSGSNNAPGIANSIAIELDTYRDVPPISADTSNNEISIHTRGADGNREQETWSIGRDTPAQNFSDGQVHTLRVVYVPGTLEVYFDNGAAPSISIAYDLTAGGTYLAGGAAPGANMQNGTAFVGFSATTGAAATLTERVEILSWDWTSTPLADPCYEGSVGADVLRVDGQSGGALRRVELATYQPFTISIDNPPQFGPGAPYLLFASFAPQPGAPGTALGFGDACFPMLPFGPSELVIADSFGVVQALLPTTATPATIPLPGVITFPLDFTLQAITFASATPLSLGLTNAVDLSFATSPAPVITSIAPASAAAGTQVTITGANFVPGVALQIGGQLVTPTSTSAGTVTFAYPAGLGCDAPLVLANPDGQGVAATLNPTPVVTTTLLASGAAAGNQVFVVQGTGFSPGTTVTIGGAAAQILSAGPTVITMRTPPGTPGLASVVLTTPGGCTATTSYTYL